MTSVMLSCSDDDSFSISSSNTLTFSTDTITMDTVFSKVPTPTYSFWVYNKSGDGIRCTSIRLANGNQTGFRANVDGEYLSQSSGYQVTNVDIRNKDSIRVFVELTSAETGSVDPQKIEDNLVFTLESGVQQSVNLNAYSWDATLLTNLEVKSDTTIDSSSKPLVIYGGITVDSAATLRIAAGSTIYFHSDAGIDVYGKLITEGSANNNVVLRGDRTDNMFDYLPYDRVSGQWNGIRFYQSSYGNSINYTDIHSTYDGVVCDSSDVSIEKLELINSTIHNCQGYGLKSTNCLVNVVNSQISNTLDDCVYVLGGSVLLLHCTLAQFYPFDADRGAALRFTNLNNEISYPLLQMLCINSIVTGYADDVLMGEGLSEDADFNYLFMNSLLRSVEPEEEDANLINIIWEDVADTDSTGEKNFKLVDIDNMIYNFRLDSISKAIGAANAEYSTSTDRDGNQRDELPDIGCYEYIKEETSN
ncbi:MAG: right-handed parallel beta-helix repeat-containing protein [Prevotellaceae bacterium]|nr:right-handed parallel beta-helix repeat-containing protein [Prevotellaceae bacterium]